MGDVTNYGLYFISIIGVLVGIYIVINWQAMLILQIMSSLLFIGLVLHEWEELRFPGGFTELMLPRIGATEAPSATHLIVFAYIIVLALVPVFFPFVIWLVLAPMFLGVLEAVLHFIGIKLMKTEKFYTPGLATAVFFLLPVSLYTIYYVSANALAIPLDWLFGLLYLLVSFGVIQVLVRRMIKA